MSIFEAKEWWSTSISNNEEFDGNSICIENIDNSVPPKKKILVSSFSGFLRIYEPSFREFKSEDMLMEKYFNAPILQIAAGNFFINSPQKNLAILQTKRLIVMTFNNLKGISNTKINYEHKLVRNGFNMCIGRIGEKNYDIIFVQSIDGTIAIYEQDHLVNVVGINEIIFPGPFAFLSRKDYLIITNTAYELECYSFNNLATTNKQDEKKILYTWLVNLGELAKEIKIIDNSLTKKQEVLVLTETMLHLVDDNGKLLFQKKLDFEPMAIFPYSICDTEYATNKLINIMYMVSTDSDHILIYKGLHLAWTVKVFDTPIFISTADFNDTNGLIVTLSDTGKLSVIYLGMEQVKNSKIITLNKNLDMETLINETQRLSELANNYEKGIVVMPKHNLVIKHTIDPKIYIEDGYLDEQVFYSDSKGKAFRCSVYLDFHFDGSDAENIKVNVIYPYNIYCEESNFTISSLSHVTSPFKKQLNFKVISSLFPTNLNVKVDATYTIKGEEAGEKCLQSVVIDFDLPLSMVMRVGTVVKDSKYKITLCSNRDVVTIPNIFKELTSPNFIDSDMVKGSSNAIGFIYPNKADVTIIISKAGGRYRIQSSNYESLLFITQKICNRLYEIYSYEIEIFIEDEINIKEYFSVVESHFNLIEKRKKCNSDLDRYTNLYTIVQKSLLNKYKEKTPSDLSNLEFLLKNVFKSISKISDEIISLNQELKVVCTQLIIWTELIIYMIKLRTKVPDDQFDLVKGLFPLDNLENFNEVSWEDTVYANVLNFLRFYFKKQGNDKVQLQEIKEVKDLSKLKKLIVTLIDNLLNCNGTFKN